MAYDGVHETILVFGGGSNGTVLDDTWLWNGSAWDEAAAPSDFERAYAPSARYGAAMTYDPARQVVVLFGGRDANGTVFNDTYEWNGTRWARTNQLGRRPVPRWGHGLAYVGGKGVVVFGGSDASNRLLDDTWVWNGFQWTPIAGDGPKPAARMGHGLAWDGGRNKTVLFGGVGSGPLGDTWELDGTRWVERCTEAPCNGKMPPRRVAPTLVYDPQRAGVLLFGGSGAKDLGDTWIWDGTGWTDARPSASPPARQRSAAAWDGARGRLILFGGRAGKAELNDTWAPGVAAGR